jgi:hypothetical protein
LRGSRHASFDREVRKEVGSFFGAQQRGMPPPMKLEEAADPADVRFLRAAAVMTHAEDFDHAVIKTRLGGPVGIQALRRESEQSCSRCAGPRSADTQKNYDLYGWKTASENPR